MIHLPLTALRSRLYTIWGLKLNASCCAIGIIHTMIRLYVFSFVFEFSSLEILIIRDKSLLEYASHTLMCICEHVTTVYTY